MKTATAPAGIFLLNALICLRLFTIEFTARMESIESSYMSISRWAMDNWADLTWFPLWFTGQPFHRVYQPGLHLSVAGLATALGWTPQHAYHFLTALAYCLTPVALFWLVHKGTGRFWWAVSAALVFSLLSPAAFFSTAIRNDAGGLLLARRFQILVKYGEGPHTTALLMLPVVMWLVDRAASARRWQFIAPAALATAALVLTNWPGTIGLALAMAAYAVSKLGGPSRLHWPTWVGIGVAAYMVAAIWVPPSVLFAAVRNAQQSDATTLGAAQLAGYAGLAAALIGLNFALGRANQWIRWFACFAVLTGAVSMGREWFGWRLLPQPNRFQLEFEMAAAGLAGILLAVALERLPRRWRIACIAVLAILPLTQAVRYRRYAHRLIPPIDITQTIEYRMAKWFNANMQGRRVFAPGNVSLWMNMFTDVPQVAGCCDQGVPTQEHRIAVYTIYTGQNAGDRDAAISLTWLKAYGADAIGVTGPRSSEYFKPYWKPWKFDGVLREMWRDGDNAVYEVPRRSRSLAHVIPAAAVVKTPPENGLITGPMEPLIGALDDPANAPASFRWLNRHEAVVEATLREGDVVFVQISHDPGWRVFEGNVERAAKPDALGLMVIDPGHAGPVKLRLIYDGGPERPLVQVISAAGWAALLGWVLLARRRARAGS
jgi:hypothetical protein